MFERDVSATLNMTSGWVRRWGLPAVARLKTRFVCAAHSRRGAFLKVGGKTLGLARGGTPKNSFRMRRP